jgi:hypothetical protein
MGGTIEACCLQPIDVIKTRLQLDKAGKYKGQQQQQQQQQKAVIVWETGTAQRSHDTPGSPGLP